MKKKFFDKVIKLDKILTKPLPELNDLKQIKKIVSDPSIENYFWRNLKQEQADWLLFLKEAGFFNILSQDSIKNNELYQTQSFISDFILLVAERYPNQAIEIIRNADTDNDRVIWNFVKVGLSLTPSNTAKLNPMVKNWIIKLNSRSTLFDSEIIKWIKHLSEGEQFNTAFELLKILTTPKVQKPSKKRDKEVEKIIGREKPKAIPPIDYYYQKELLSKGLTKLIEYDPLKLSKLLQISLECSIKIEYGHIKEGYDLSYIWRAAIEEHPQNYEYYDLKDALLVALRKSTEELVKRDKTEGLKIIKEYLAHSYSIFRRLAIHLLRLNYDQYSNFINKFIKSKKLLKETDISHEYYILLRDIFEKLDRVDKKFIIDSILEIQSYAKDAKPEIQEKQIRYYHLEKLHFFEKYLVGEEKEYYDKLKQEFQGERLRDTTVWHESYTGERSPLSIDEIEKKELSELWDYFRTFRKTKRDFDTPSPEGLARIFGAAVKKNPKKYLDQDLTPLTELKPNYSYWFLNDVAELYKSEKFQGLLPFLSNLLNFINRVVRIENIPKRFTDDMGINFVSVKIRAIDFIQAIIKTHQRELEYLKYRDKIWEIIEYLCYYELDPDESRENKEQTLDPFTLAINSVRGNALIGVIDYALWYAYHTKEIHSSGIKYPNRFKGEERIQKLLDDKLNNKLDDPSLAIHSVFGVYLSNLAYLNYDWVKDNIDKIFPEDMDKEIYWKTAWGGFINASRFYTDLFKLFNPHFERAINYLTSGVKMIPSGFGRSPEDALSEHLIIACLNGKDNIRKSNSLFRKFVEIPINPSVTHAVQFIANLAKDERIFYEDLALGRKSFWPQAKEFWKIRIDIVKKLEKKRKVNVEDEFDREFSTYINWLDDLPDEVTLKELEPLLHETIKINRRGWHMPGFIEYLYRQSEKYPHNSIRLFEKLMCTNAPNFFFLGKEKEIELILENAIKTKKDEVYDYADTIVNKFGIRGNYYFKNFWLKHLKGKKIRKIVRLTKK